MNDQQEIDRYNQAFQDALQRGDADACAGLCTADAVMMPPEASPVIGRAAIHAHFASLGSDSSVSSSVVELEISGNLAYQYSRVSWDSDTGTRYTDSLDLLQRQADGRWLLRASAWNTSSGFDAPSE